MLILRKFLRDVPAVVGALLVIGVLILAIFGPWIAPYLEDASASHLLRRLKPPSAAFPFGTDNLGRDIFSRVILGARGALKVALVVVGLSMAVGVPLGLVAGYGRGLVPEAIMRVTEPTAADPRARLGAAVGPFGRKRDAGAVAHLLALLHPHRPCRDAAVAQCIVHRRVAGHRRRHPAHPAAAHPAQHPFAHHRARDHRPGFTILVAAVLGFLGMGATPPDPDWGLAVAQSRTYLPKAWWFATFPGLAILLAVLGFNLLGDGLRDLVDPRLRRSR